MRLLSTLLLSLSCILAFAQPTNDNCSTATPVQVGGPETCNPLVFSNLDATSDTTAPAPTCANYQGGDVWFQVTVPAGGSMILELNQDTAAFDMGMSVYSGACGDLTQVACNDDGGEGLFSLIELAGQTAGETFYVRAWEYGNNLVSSFTFCAYEPPLCNPITNLGFDAIGTDFIDVSWESINVDSQFTLEWGDEGFALGSGMVITGEVGVDGPPVMIDGLTLGTAYDFYLFEVCQDGGLTDTLFSTITTPMNPPANDDCADATPLQVGGPGVCNPQTFSTIDATDNDDAPAPGCANYLGGDVWFRAIVPASGVFFVETSQDTVGIDTGMAIYTGTCDELTLVSCNDDGGEGLYSLNEVSTVAAGENVYIRVWEYGNDNQGTFNICCYETPLCNEITGLQLDSVSLDLLSVTWNSVNIDATFSLEYGETGFAQGAGTVITGDVGVDGPPVEIPALASGTGYDVYLYEVCVDANLTDTLFGTFFTQFEPPANDDLCDAIEIVVQDPQVSMDMNGATSEPNEPEGSCWLLPGTVINSVWAYFEAPASGIATITTDFDENTFEDTHITIYSLEGGDCTDLSTLVEYGCDEDGGELGAFGWSSTAIIDTLVPGDTYYIQIDGYGTGVGQFFLRVFEGATSVDEFSTIDLNIFPNPATDNITVDAAAIGQVMDMELIDINGRVISRLSSQRTDGPVTMDVSTVRPGMYIVRMIGEGKQAIERIVIQ